MAKTNEQKEAEAAAKRQQALTEAQASGDPDRIAAAQADIDKALESAESEADDADAAAADRVEEARLALEDAERQQGQAEARAFQARARASTESLLASDPGRQVSYLPTQVIYRQGPAPIEPATFRQVVHPTTGHITNEGIGAEE